MLLSLSNASVKGRAFRERERERERILFIRRLIFAERHFVREVDSDPRRDGGPGFCRHRCGRDVPSVPPEQPPLSAASPRELIYNAHLGNTKGLLSFSRFNVFSPRVAVARCPFYTLFRRRRRARPFPAPLLPSFPFPSRTFPSSWRRARDVPPSPPSSLVVLLPPRLFAAFRFAGFRYSDIDNHRDLCIGLLMTSLDFANVKVGRI